MNKKIASARRRTTAGLTLVELVTTLAVGTVLLSVGVSSYQAVVDNQHLHTRINQLVSHLHLARSESVKRFERVALCPSSDGETCDDTFDWSNGWLVFVDNNRDKERQSEEQLLKKSEGTEPIEVVTSTGRRSVTYEPDGTVIGGSNATFKLCSEKVSGRNRAVIVSNTGRPRLSDKDADNRPVDCS